VAGVIGKRKQSESPPIGWHGQAVLGRGNMVNFQSTILTCYLFLFYNHTPGADTPHTTQALQEQNKKHPINLVRTAQKNNPEFPSCPYKKQPQNRRRSVLSDRRFIPRLARIFIDFFARLCYSNIIKHGFGGRDNAVMKSK